MFRQLSGRFQAKPPTENNQLIGSFNLTKGYQLQKSGVAVHDPNCFLFLMILCFFYSHPTPPPPHGPAAGARAGPSPWNIPRLALHRSTDGAIAPHGWKKIGSPPAIRFLSRTFSPTPPPKQSGGVGEQSGGGPECLGGGVN